jgi:hypothetical protein
MGAAGETRRSYEAYHIALGYHLSFFHKETRIMSVHDEKTLVVLDLHDLAISDVVLTTGVPVGAAMSIAVCSWL